MASFVHPFSASLLGPAAARQTPSSARRNLLGGLIDVIFDARKRQAEREVARFIQGNGGRLTDELERQISQRFGPPA